MMTPYVNVLRAALRDEVFEPPTPLPVALDFLDQLLSSLGSNPRIRNRIDLKIKQHRLRQRMDAKLLQLGITKPQNPALIAVAGNPRISNAALARAAFVTPQTMQGILVNLKRSGLIVRSAHPAPGQVIMTELTEAGQKAVVAGSKAADPVEQRMLSTMSTKRGQVSLRLA